MLGLFLIFEIIKDILCLIGIALVLLNAWLDEKLKEPTELEKYLKNN